jgi:hypothetical protein
LYPPSKQHIISPSLRFSTLYHFFPHSSSFIFLLHPNNPHADPICHSLTPFSLSQFSPPHILRSSALPFLSTASRVSSSPATAESPTPARRRASLARLSRARVLPHPCLCRCARIHGMPELLVPAGLLLLPAPPPPRLSAAPTPGGPCILSPTAGEASSPRRIERRRATQDAGPQRRQGGWGWSVAARASS